MECCCTEALWANQDPAYRDFQGPLIPTVERDRIIGVRLPVLRSLAKQFYGTAQGDAFLTRLPHRYLDENNLHCLMISRERDFDRCLESVEAFLPFVDNWATCDSLRPGAFGKHKQQLLPHLRRWLSSPLPYTQRFAMEMLMVHYLDGDFQPEYLAMAAVESQEYYVNMMVAWYFATALAKQWDAAIPWIQEGKLPPWVRNKTIQKALESRRISPEQKAYLRTLRQ